MIRTVSILGLEYYIEHYEALCILILPEGITTNY
jgi:hypothetical protein